MKIAAIVILVVAFACTAAAEDEEREKCMESLRDAITPDMVCVIGNTVIGYNASEEYGGIPMGMACYGNGEAVGTEGAGYLSVWWLDEDYYQYLSWEENEYVLQWISEDGPDTTAISLSDLIRACRRRRRRRGVGIKI